MRKRDHGLLTNTASLLLCGLLAGLVVAATAFPVIAMSGLAAKASADTFESLPGDFEVLPSPQISYVYASDDTTLLAQLYDENRKDVKLGDVSEIMRKAIVAAEDTRFYEHHGVDLKGLARAVVNNQNGGGKQGASTLTMQYVRQVVLYSARTPQDVVDATEQTPSRKAREIRYAIALEKKISKEEILEKYLNIAAFGHGAWGIYAASHVYFDKDPKDLSLPEAALLASVVKAPTTFDPATDDGRPKALERSRNYTLNNMVKLGFITQAERDEAAKAEPQITGKRTPEGCSAMTHQEWGAGFFCDFFIRWWKSQPAFGADEYERENRLRSGGYRITLSLDANTQASAFKYAQQQPGVSKLTEIGDELATMTAAVEPGTGRVKALATNRVFDNSQDGNGPNTNPAKRGQKGNYPKTTVPLMTGGGDITGYQAGSAFKIFTIAAALESGVPLEYTIDAQQTYVSNYIVGPGDATCNGNHYCPTNASASMAGQHNMWSAFGFSVNTYFVPLEEQVGADKVVDMAKRLGIQFRSTQDADYASPKKSKQWGAFTLGVSATTPLDLANAYATLAADGNYCEPIPVTQILDRDGNKVDAGNPRCKQVTSPDVARGAVDAARCPVGDRSSTSQCKTATAGYVKDIVDRPIAGKTGTTSDEKSATFTVMTKQLAVSSFLTDPDWPQTNQNMDHPHVNRAAAYTLRDALDDQPVVDFTPPSKDITSGKNGSLDKVPDVKCRSVDDAKRTINGAGFKASVGGQQTNSNCPAGTVASTSPSGKAPKGASIQLILSNGQPQGNAAPDAPDAANGEQPPARPGRRNG